MTAVYSLAVILCNLTLDQLSIRLSCLLTLFKQSKLQLKLDYCNFNNLKGNFDFSECTLCSVVFPLSSSNACASAFSDFFITFADRYIFKLSK